MGILGYSIASKDIYPQGSIRKLWLKTELFYYLKFVKILDYMIFDKMSIFCFNTISLNIQISLFTLE